MAKTTLPSREDACALLGCSDRELVGVVDSPAGPIFNMSDGNSYINVTGVDADGKTGLMYLQAPNVAGGYKGVFPVYTAEPDTGDGLAAPVAADPGQV